MQMQVRMQRCSRARMHASCMGTVAGRRRASRVSSRRGRRWPARAAWPAGKKPRRLFCLRGSRKAGRRRAYGEACAWCRQRRCDVRGGKRDEGFCPESQVVRRRAARPRPWTIARFVPVSKRKEVEVQCTVVRTYHRGLNFPDGKSGKPDFFFRKISSPLHLRSSVLQTDDYHVDTNYVKRPNHKMKMKIDD